MRRSVYLHVGAPLTGSAYLRESLARHRRRLARAGVLFPTSHLGHAGGHLDAVLDVLALAGPGNTPAAGAWDRLAETVRDWRRGTVVLSHELLADATLPQVERVLGSFGDAEVHVVYAARDLGRQLPLAWQEWVRNGGTAPFATYAARVLARDSHRMARVFWSSHDIGDVLERWAAYLPPAQVHVIPVPDTPDQDAVLWHRFTRTVGIDPRNLAVGADPHRRLDPIAATEVLRLLNLATGESADPGRLRVLVDDLAGTGGALPRLPATLAEPARAEAAAAVEAVRSRGYDVVGDLSDLLPDDDLLSGGERELSPATEDVLAAQTRLLAAVAGLRRTENGGPAGFRRRALRELSRRRPGAAGRRSD